MVLIPKKSRRAILEHLFKEGVMVVKKDYQACKHNELEDIPNLHVMMVLRSLASRNYLSEIYSWQWHYYTLTNEGIEYLREVLHLPQQVFPQTLTKQRPTRPALAGGDSSEGKGKGKGWNREELRCSCGVQRLFSAQGCCLGRSAVESIAQTCRFVSGRFQEEG